MFAARNLARDRDERGGCPTQADRRELANPTSGSRPPSRFYRTTRCAVRIRGSFWCDDGWKFERVITIAMSIAVGAGRDRVWRALTVPDELIRWDDKILSLLDPPDGYPRVGQQIRWRYRVGAIPVMLRNSAIEVIPNERLRTVTAMGLFRFDETFTLGNEGNDLHRTRLQLKLSAANSLAVVGGLLDRFTIRRVGSELVDRKLHCIQKWCENHP